MEEELSRVGGERPLGGQDLPRPATSQTVALTVEQFRAEVRDKLFVVFHGCHSTPLERAIHRQQCEDFLVERYAEVLPAFRAALGEPTTSDAVDPVGDRDIDPSTRA